MPNVIFDFCDVLLQWDPKGGTYDLFAGEVGVKVWRDFYDEDADFGFWHYDGLLDAGMDEGEAARDYRAHHRGEEGEGAFDLYLEHRDLAFRGMIPGMDTLLETLHTRGVALWGLMNFTDDAVKYAQSKYPAMRLLDDVVVSSVERVKKPDRRIYEIAIKRFGVDPAQTVFIDDKPWNVDGARESSLRSFVFVNAMDARSQLAKAGIRF